MSREYGYISEDIIAEISAKSDIVEVINRYVPLKRSGANYLGLCPFHSEKTPSFSVSPSKQIFHCFGCGKGGNVFKFLMEIDNLSFPEAVRELAKQAHVVIPEKKRSKTELANESLKNECYKVNDLAKNYYHNNLIYAKHPESITYLKSRQLKQETISLFQLGTTEKGSWDGLYQYLSQQGVSIEMMLTLGLVSPRKDGLGYVDRFRNRIIFPIVNEFGKTIGFGGRTLEKDAKLQKYLNSPETPVFQKSDMLYGLNLSRKAIRREDKVILVEGYLDLIQLYQNDIQNVVAPLGTALTNEQVKKLMRQTYNFAILFDGDEAGKNAGKRAYQIIQSQGARGRVVLLPDKNDPDEYIKKEGRLAMQERINQAQSGLLFTLDLSIEENGNEKIEDKLKNLYEILPLISQIHSRAEFEASLFEISEKLQLSSQAILDELNRYKKNGRFKSGALYEEEAIKKTEIDFKAEILSNSMLKNQGLLLYLLMTTPRYLRDVERFGGSELFDEVYKGLYKRVQDLIIKEIQINGDTPFSEDTDLFLFLYTQLGVNAEEDLVWQDLFKKVVNTYLDSKYETLTGQIALLEKNGEIDQLGLCLSELNFILEQKKLI